MESPLAYFSSLTDPRVERTREHRLDDILFIFAAQNYSLLNRIALNLLKNDKKTKVGVKGKRLKAGWDNQYLIKIIKN